MCKSSSTILIALLYMFSHPLTAETFTVEISDKSICREPSGLLFNKRCNWWPVDF